LASAYFLHEVLGQRGDVAGRSRSGGSLQVHDVEAVEQVLAERALAHRFLQVAVRGGDDADVDRHRPRAADAVDHALLDGAQQLGLQAHVHLGDFVEQQRAAVASSNLPMRRATAPVKAPFSWPNSSLSSRFSGIAAQLTEMNGLSARFERA
jgi:hypothetical protein